MPTQYQAIMFDLDGTLVNTLAAIAAAANSALEQLGRPTHSIQQYRQFVGYGLPQLVRQALGPDHLDLADQAAALHREAYARLESSLAHPYEHVPQLLAELRRRGLKLAVLSNKPHDATCQCVRTFLGPIHLDAIRGHQPPTPLKPDPHGALAIARDLDVTPDRWLYVGDSEVDMHTAVAAGMVAVGATWGFRDQTVLQAAGAQALIHNPMQLLDLLA